MAAGVAALVLVQGADVASTLAILAAGGGEANPLMAGVVGRPGLFVAVKLASCGVAPPLLAILHTIRPWLVVAALALLVALYLPVLVGNARVLAWLT